MAAPWESDAQLEQLLLHVYINGSYTTLYTSSFDPKQNEQFCNFCCCGRIKMYVLI